MSILSNYEQNAINIFKENTTHELHSNSTFYDHCMGVFNILKEYECPESITVAALYHSYFGTCYFTPVSIDKNTPLALNPETTQLVNLFSNTENRTTRIIDGSICTCKRTLQDLRWIEYANLTEQFPRIGSPTMLNQINVLVNLIKEFKND